MTAALRELQVVVDRQVIRDLIYRMSRGQDRADAELRRSVLTPDALFHYGMFDGPAAEYLTWLSEQSRSGTYDFEATHHLLGQTLIDVAGDHAASETWFQASHALRDPDGREYVIFHGGRYFDRFVRADNGWLMSERTMILDWELSQRSDQTCPVFPNAGRHIRGKRGPDDPTGAAGFLSTG
jgi:SnoaL-like domain